MVVSLNDVNEILRKLTPETRTMQREQDEKFWTAMCAMSGPIGDAARRLAWCPFCGVSDPPVWAADHDCSLVPSTPFVGLQAIVSHNNRSCACGHRFLDHAPNWMVVPALSPCTECECLEFQAPG